MSARTGLVSVVTDGTCPLAVFASEETAVTYLTSAHQQGVDGARMFTVPYVPAAKQKPAAERGYAALKEV